MTHVLIKPNPMLNLTHLEGEDLQLGGTGILLLVIECNINVRKAFKEEGSFCELCDLGEVETECHLFPLRCADRDDLTVSFFRETAQQKPKLPDIILIWTSVLTLSQSWKKRRRDWPI